MPEVTIDGLKKKVACGPCIRGHRSSKCTHKDRVLIEVRKPGRPLSSCPHPTGSCSCERVVISYTIPKTGDCACPSAQATAVSTSVAGTPRVQKTKARKSISNVTPSTVDRALNGDPQALAQQTSQAGSSRSASSSRSSLVTTSSATSDGSTPKPEKDGFNLPQAQEEDSVKQEDGDSSPKLRLGMLGVGGYGAAPDEIGWSGEWPEYNPRPEDPPEASSGNQAGSCCSGGSSDVQRQQPPAAAPKSSCCGGNAVESLSQQNPQDQSLQRAGVQGAYRNQPAGPMQVPFIFSNGQFALQQQAQVFGHGHGNGFVNLEPRPGVVFMPTSTAYMNGYTTGLSQLQPVGSEVNSVEHNCNCGDSCLCFACATHPNNRTTTEYVRYHNDLAMGYAPSFQMLPRQIQQVYGQQQNVPMGMYGHQQNMPQFPGNYGGQFLDTQFFSDPRAQWGPQTQAFSVQPTPTLELEQVHLQTPRPMDPAFQPFDQNVQNLFMANQNNRNTTTNNFNGPPHEQHEPSTFNQPSYSHGTLVQTPRPEEAGDPSSPEDESGTPDTLSPSNFVFSQFTLPGCADANGRCQCDASCECPDCLTHKSQRNFTPLVDAPVSRAVDNDLNGFAVDFTPDQRNINGGGFVHTTAGEVGGIHSFSAVPG
ncbi:hypothetical protein K402DRAFT_420942 [Aulographum hederae CBS 113979]|uniref:Copper-fist domain-containing protein n=1 Tax=Aulographum hederae CBS 113979 TaxID=1176131 RepID=A0A6G1H1H2_9PEZI|nr:hypothetical protein K402DRAFT_420942 [Aulographum hederae CBS 113979]